jgi:hypothetical protein
MKMKNKHVIKHTDSIILLKVSACLHTATRFQYQLFGMQYEVLKHPPFNPDLLLCVVHIINLLKKALKGRVFPLDDTVVEAVAQGIFSRWDMLAMR